MPAFKNLEPSTTTITCWNEIPGQCVWSHGLPKHVCPEIVRLIDRLPIRNTTMLSSTQVMLFMPRGLDDVTAHITCDQAPLHPL